MVEVGVAEVIAFVAVVPAKVTVPLLCAKVPLFVNVPLMVITPEYAVSELAALIVKLLKAIVGVPVVVIAVDPPNVAVSLPAPSTPLTTILPVTVYAALGVTVVPLLIVIADKDLAPTPVIVIIPAVENVVVAVDVKLPVPVKVVPLMERFEFAASDIPLLIVILLSATVPDPELLSAVVPLNVVVLFPAARVPVPLSVTLPVIE